MSSILFLFFFNGWDLISIRGGMIYIYIYDRLEGF